MSYIDKSATLTQDQVNQTIAQIKTIKANLAFLVGLSSSEKKRMRKMGDNLTSYVLDVRTLVATYPNSVSGEVDIAQLTQNVDLIVKLDSIMAELRPLYSELYDTNMALGSEALRVVDICYSYLKVSARNNPALKESVAAIGARFKHNKKPKNTPPVATQI